MTLTRSHYTAIGIALVLAIWMLTGEATTKEATSRNLSASDQLFQVQYKQISGEVKQHEVRISGRVAVDRRIDVMAEVNGKIEQVIKQRGSPIKKGEVILTIEPRDRPARLAQAKAALEQARLELSSTQKLFKQGLTNETTLISARANVATAEANVTQMQVNLDATKVRAPFDGIMDQRYVEQGQFVSSGTSLVRVLDTSPMLVKGKVAEKDISYVRQGDVAYAEVLNGGRVEGKIRFIASAADIETRSYDIEMAITSALPESGLYDGQTATLYIPEEEVYAYYLSPALLIMTKDDQLGLKVLSEDNRVEIIPVKILTAEDTGVWVYGPNESIKLITLGQGFVNEGELVKPVAEAGEAQ